MNLAYKLMPDSSSAKKRPTILLVDDSPRVRPLVRQILEDAGWTVVEAQSPQEALSLLAARDSKIDLLLTDFMMPEMSGIVLAERVNQQHPRIKVLCMSGYDVDPGRHAGIAFIEKPFRPDELIAKIRAILEVA
jgi:two-component system cell cycle sensor histidine kinase/response regulator CckA